MHTRAGLECQTYYQKVVGLTHGWNRYHMVSTWMSECLCTSEPSRYMTNHRGQLSLLLSLRTCRVNEYQPSHRGQPPCHGGRALHWWPERFLKSGGEELTESWPNLWEQIATRYQCFCAGFGFTADYGFIAVYLRLYSRLLMASQPSMAL